MLSYCENPATSKNTLFPELNRLRRLQFLANYGDYCRVKLTNFRVSARKISKEIPGIESLTDSTVFWTTIQEQLEKEAEAKQDPKDFSPQYRSPHMTDLVDSVCDTLGYNRGYIKHIIALYAERNGQVQSDVAPMIEQCRFPELGVRLFQDTQDLTRDLKEQAIGNANDRRVILTAITELKEMYFLSIGRYKEDVELSPLAEEEVVASLFKIAREEEARVAKKLGKEEKDRARLREIELSVSSSERKALKTIRQGRASEKSSEDWSASEHMSFQA